MKKALMVMLIGMSLLASGCQVEDYTQQTRKLNIPQTAPGVEINFSEDVSPKQFTSELANTSWSVESVTINKKDGQSVLVKLDQIKDVLTTEQLNSIITEIQFKEDYFYYWFGGKEYQLSYTQKGHYFMDKELGVMKFELLDKDHLKCMIDQDVAIFSRKG